MAERFGQRSRLRNRGEFKQVESQGRRVAGRYLTLVAKPNGGERDRLGIIASRRVGGAVARNRAKRRLREVFRRHAPAGGSRSLDVVAIAKVGMPEAPSTAVAAEFVAALSRLRGAR